MDYNLNLILLVGPILLVLAVISSNASERFGIPVQLIFLAVGMLAGSDGFGGLNFEDYILTEMIGTISLVLILFSGGLESNWKAISYYKWTGLSLASMGVIVTTFVMGACVHFLTGIDWYQALLLGAIVSSTDASAVMAVFKTKRLELKGGLKQILEFESGVNDPTAYFLVTTFIGLINIGQLEFSALMTSFLWNMASGAIVGYIVAILFVKLVKVAKLGHDGLYPALALAIALLTYGLTYQINGNGFLSVYVLGITLGNRRFVHKQTILVFYDGISWLMQVVMFLILGLLVFPNRLVYVATEGVVLALGLILLARPIAVFISTARAQLSWREKAFISWVGLRGAVPIVFACLLPIKGVQNSQFIFNLVFFIVIISALLQGTTLELAAKWLNVKSDVPYKRPIDQSFQEQFKDAVATYRIKSGSVVDSKKIIDISLPKGTLLLYIKRDGRFLTPNGSTILLAGDEILLISAEKGDLDLVQDLFERA